MGSPSASHPFNTFNAQRSATDRGAPPIAGGLFVSGVAARDSSTTERTSATISADATGFSRTLSAPSFIAATVTGVVRPGQANAVRQFGADETTETIEALLGAIGEGAAKPFDAVLDLVSDGETLKKHASLVKRGGTLVTTIHVADEKWFAQRSIQAVNIDLAATPQSSPEGLNQLARMVANRTLNVAVAAGLPATAGGTIRRRQNCPRQSLWLMPALLPPP